jgi:beta-catenin-like protein 1
VPALSYPKIVDGAIALLIGLLSHENADIVIDVVEVVHELTDEDVGNEADLEDEEEEENSEALKLLINSLVRYTFGINYLRPDVEISAGPLDTRASG